jgi:hypothetical protein
MLTGSRPEDHVTLIVKYLFSSKYQAILSHLLLGGVWTIVLFTTRYLFSSDLKPIIGLHAEVVFLSFIISFGFSTLGRLLVYENKIATIRQIVVIFSACQAFLAFVSLIIGEHNGISLAISALYNNIFLMVNISIAMKSYRYTAIYSLVCVGVVLAGSASIVFNFSGLYLVIITLTNLAVFFLFLFKYKNKVSFKLANINFNEFLRAPSFLISGLPLRAIIYLLGAYFGSNISSSQESFLYADALIYFGIVSVVAGRYFLFNEQFLKSLATRGAYVFLTYQLVLVLPFFLYSFWTSSVEWPVVISISALYSSREIFGLHVAFMDKKTRFTLVGLYGLVVVLSFSAYELFGYFYLLVPACIFFTAYYIIFRPLKSKEDGINLKEA